MKTNHQNTNKRNINTKKTVKIYTEKEKHLTQLLNTSHFPNNLEEVCA